MMYPVLLNLTRISILLLLMLTAVAQAQYRNNDVSQMKPAGIEKPAQTELSFVRNLGQWPDQVRFAARMKGVDLWVTDSSVLYDLHTITNLSTTPVAPALDQARERGNERQLRRGHLVNMRFAGASAAAMAEGARKMEGHHNYYVGNDPARWAMNVPLYHETRIRNLYPGISLLLHFDGGLPRYDFLLEPNADPRLIRLDFDGADGLSITPSGELAISTSLGVVRQQRLFAYQIVNGRKRSIPCSFRMLEDGTIGFKLGRYDARLPLIIDPILYSTFIGGSGNDNALALAVDGSMNTCLTGYAGAPSPFADAFPTTLGAYSKEQHGSNSDVFVAKVSSTNKLVFSTIIGGKGFEDGRDIGVDATGNIYVTGFTESANFPTTAGAFRRAFTGGSHDAFVLKLSPDGTSLLYSTFVGGSHSDAAYSLALEPNGQVRVIGSTFSEDFPTTAGAFDRTHNGQADIMAFTLAADGASLVSSTFIGGSGNEYAAAIERDSSGRSNIVGTTGSTDFPVTANAVISQNRGRLDAIVIRLDGANTSLLYGTYMGGSNDDFGQDIVIGLTSSIVICGYTASRDYLVEGSAFQRTFRGGTYDGFISRISNGGVLLHSGFIGGSGEDFAMALAQYGDRTWIGGSTDSKDFRYTLAVPDSSYNGAQDGFVMLLDLIGDSLHYSTFVGGNGRDVVQDIAYVINPELPRWSRHLHICGTTISENYPTTRDAYQSSLARRFEGGQDSSAPSYASYDGFFMRVETTAVILLTQTPSNQLVLCPNSDYEIRWASFDMLEISLTLRDESGRVYHSLLLNNPTTVTKFSWLIPDNHPPGTRFRLHISMLVDPPRTDLFWDMATIDFTILDGPKLIRGITGKDVCPGEKVDFSVEAEGPNISYLWRHNGFTISDEKTPSLIIDSVTARDTGTYEAVVFSGCGSVAFTQTVKLRLKPTPVITKQPADAISCTGNTTSLRVTAVGDDLRYQWYKDGTQVPGATSAELNILNVASQDEGYYTVRVTSGICPESPIPSARARLKVVYERIIEQPRNQSVGVGEPVSFTVLAFGHNPTYQWRKDGEDIPGANISTYSIKRVKLSDSGRYDVVVNGECQIISSTALLTVTTFSGVTGERGEAASSLIMVEPNPVNARGVIRITTGAAGLHGSELALYDVLGRKVMDLTTALHSAAGGPIDFDAGDLPAGIYYCRLTGGDQTGTSTMVVVEK